MQELETYYRNNYDRLVNQCKRQLGGVHNAEDAVQEAFARAIKFLPSYNGHDDFGSWFSGILSNSVKNIKRSERHKGASLDENQENLLPFNPSPEFKLMFKEIQQDIYSVENRLHHNILRMYFLTQHSPKEIAEIVDETPNNVRTIVHRYREELKNKYGKNLYR